MAEGMVYLIGAGPGDPELLTLKAVRALAGCDVVLIDDLVHRDVLRHCRPGVRVVDVGKRGGCASTLQQFIERLMIRLARRGAIVGRLKGGDPCVFGCGVTLVTGHTQPGGAEPDWAALARSGTTLVVYMGLANLATITVALRRGSLPDDTPAAAIQDGTLPQQASVVTTLARLAEEVAARGIRSPAVVVIGAVAALARDQALPLGRSTAARLSRSRTVCACARAWSG